MTTSERIARRRLSLLELGEYLENVSEACRVMGVSRQHFYELKKSYEEGGLDELNEKSRRVPNPKNRVTPEVEEAILQFAEEYPAYGQTRVSNELRKRGIEVSPAEIRGVWLRHQLQTIELRLRRLEVMAAEDGRILTDRGTEYCGRPDRHPYQLFLQLNDIEHTRTKARHPQTNGICERFNKTILNEFYQVVFRKNIYQSLEELHKGQDDWLVTYNEERSHQGKRCQWRTPLQTFIDGKVLVREKMLA